MGAAGPDEDEDESTSDEVTTQIQESTKEEEEGGDAIKYAIAACVVAALIILLAIGFLVATSKTESSAEKHVEKSESGQGGGLGGGSGGGAGSGEDNSAVTSSKGHSHGRISVATTGASSSHLSPTKRKTGSTQRSSRQDETSLKKTYTKASTKPTLTTTLDPLIPGTAGTTQRPMPEGTLLCTVRSNLKPDTNFPVDGLCDIMFYDSMMEKGTINKLAGPYTASVEYFLKMAGKYQKTESGVGIASVNDIKNPEMNALLKRSNVELKRVLFFLWSKKIYHFGVLDKRFNCYTRACIQLHMNVLKTIFHLLEGKRSNDRPCYLVFNHIFYNAVADLKSLKAALPMFPHGMIFTSHFTQKEAEVIYYNCKIMPPQFLTAPAEVPVPDEVKLVKKGSTSYNYDYDMNVTHLALLNWADGQFGPPAYFISAALEGRRYKFEGPDYGFLQQCNKRQQVPNRNASLTEVCNESAYNVTSVEKWGTVAANPDSKMVVTYDDQASFRYKFCTMKKRMPHVKYGIVAYSVNTDDTADVCGDGPYARLKTLRWLVDFFKDKFKDASEVDACIQGE